MASFSFLHAADIHLDSPLTGLSRYEGVPAEQVRRAPRDAFDRLIATAIERRVDFMVIAGDLYDGDWKDAGTGLYFAAAMGKLARADIPVYLLAGNHDADSVITRDLPQPANVHGFDHRKPQTHYIPHLGVAIHGRSFTERAATENLAAGYPDPLHGTFNIGVLHTSLTGDDHGHATYAPCTPQELAARGYDYWALGHVHEHQIVSEAPHIVFPGNLQGRNIREDGPRGAVIVEVEEGEVALLTRLELDVVRWARIDVPAHDASMGVLHDRIADALRRALDSRAGGRPLIVRLGIVGETALHGALQDVSARLRDDVRGLAAGISTDIWIEKVRVRTTPSRSDAQEDGIGDLIPQPDAELALRLKAELGRFLSMAPREEGSLVEQAFRGDWHAVMRAAGDALRHRLGVA